MNSPSRVDVVLLLIGLSSCISQRILDPPSNLTVFIDQSAVFTCETDGGLPGWRVNGTLLQDLPPDIRSDLVVLETNTDEGSTLEQITIPARAEYNTTKIQCLALAVAFSGSEESENATIIIQGLLSALTNLAGTDDETSVTISWTAPFSLDVTGVDPDIWYSVLIYNVTDENNPTAILCTDCINITETHYTFTPDYSSPCHVYNFSVIPVNGAGEGESSANVSGIVLNFPDLGKPCVEALSTGRICKVSFEVLGGHSGRCRYNITPEVMDDCIIAQLPSTEGPSFTFYLCADRIYSFEFLVSNAAGKNATTLISFSTFHIQSATVSSAKDGSGIILTAEFIKHSTARGCFIVLQPEDGSPDVFRAVLRSEFSTVLTTTIIEIPSSTYNVLIFELQQDGLPNRRLAYEDSKGFDVAWNDSALNPESNFLKDASVNISKSTVRITCVFKDGTEGASCVLVYRQYDKKTLLGKEYPQNTSFPVSVMVDDPENYTFAIFGKNSSNFDTRPIIDVKSQAIAGESSLSPFTVAPTSGVNMKPETRIVVISISTVVVCAITCSIVVCILVAVRRHHIHKSATGKKNSSASLSTAEAVVTTGVVCVVCSFTAGLLLGVLLTQCHGHRHRKGKRGQTEIPEDIPVEKTPPIELNTNEAYGLTLNEP